MRIASFRILLTALALAASAPALAAMVPQTEPPVRVFRGEEIAILLLGIAGVLIGHRGSRSRKQGDDPKA
ncbi:MAG: hypothetical protein RIS11_811 [Pseudomonadota bacterium]